MNEDYKDNLLTDYIENKRNYKIQCLLNNNIALNDYEILELIFHSTCKDMPISPPILAKNLINTFGSIGKILSCELHELKNIEGLNSESIMIIFCIKEALTRMLREETVKSPVKLNNYKVLINYLKMSIGYINYKECLQVIYLNKKYSIVSENIQRIGTIDQTPFYHREIIKHAFMVGATAIIISHNHPSGDPTPSKQDISLTKELSSICYKLNIEVIDHIIITPQHHFSFSQNGLL